MKITQNCTHIFNEKWKKTRNKYDYTAEFNGNVWQSHPLYKYTMFNRKWTLTNTLTNIRSMITETREMQHCLTCIKTYSTLYYVQFFFQFNNICVKSVKKKGKFIFIYKNQTVNMTNLPWDNNIWVWGVKCN